MSLTFTGCDKDDTEETQQDNTQSTVVKAFLPSTYADKTVAAWYSIYSEADYKTKIEAVFLFTDSSLVVTKSKVYSEEDGRDPSRVVMYEGQFRISEGDYDNGTLLFAVTPGSSIQVEITDGKLSFMGQTYAKQANSKVPAATKTTENEFIGTVQPYLPAFNIEINYAAWYTSTTQQTNSIKIDAIYLNTDSLMLYTRSRFYTQKDGRKPSYEVIDIGTYKLTEGDYTTGAATLTLSTGDVYDAIIADGQMSVMDVTFIKQDNDKLPEPVK